MSIGKILLGALAGVAAGTAMGILLAPDKGSVTRKKIMDMADEWGEDIKEKISNSIKTINNNFDNATDETKDLVDKGKSKIEDVYNKFKNDDHHDRVLPKVDLKL